MQIPVLNEQDLSHPDPVMNEQDLSLRRQQFKMQMQQKLTSQLLQQQRPPLQMQMVQPEQPMVQRQNGSHNLTSQLKQSQLPQQNDRNCISEIMRLKQAHQDQLDSEIDGQMSSGELISTEQKQDNINQKLTQMVQSEQQRVQRLQQTSSFNLNSQFRANGTLNSQEIVQMLPLQDALAATQGQNAQISGSIQSGQPGVLQNATSTHPWFKQMQGIDSPDSSLHLFEQQRLQSPRMVDPGDQKPVCLTVTQPDDATLGRSSSHGTKVSIRKRMIRDVVSQLDLNGNLDPEVEDLIFRIADNFIDSVTTLARNLAKHPKSSTLESKDVLLHPGGSKQDNSKSSVCDFGHRRPQAVYCHYGCSSSIQSNRTSNSKLGAQRSGEWCDREMCRRCNDIVPGILCRRCAAEDVQKNECTRCNQP